MEEKELRVLHSTTLGVEQRTIKRADGEEEVKEVIAGKAVVFNELSQRLGWFRERIDPSAFEGCDMSDVVCLKNHDDNLLLGRTGSGLDIEIRADGLYFVVTPPNTQTARDTLEEIRSGAIKGCSFQFSIARDGDSWDIDPETEMDIRTVKKIAKLYDVGPVTFPAYLQTSTDVAKRSHEEYRREKESTPTQPVHFRRLHAERRLKLHP